MTADSRPVPWPVLMLAYAAVCGEGVDAEGDTPCPCGGWPVTRAWVKICGPSPIPDTGGVCDGCGGEGEVSPDRARGILLRAASHGVARACDD